MNGKNNHPGPIFQLSKRKAQRKQGCPDVNCRIMFTKAEKAKKVKSPMKFLKIPIKRRLRSPSKGDLKGQ